MAVVTVLPLDDTVARCIWSLKQQQQQAGTASRWSAIRYLYEN